MHKKYFIISFLNKHHIINGLSVDISNPSTPSGPLTTSAVEVVSPNFPGGYGNNRVCELSVMHPTGDDFEVDFLDFEVEVS